MTELTQRDTTVISALRGRVGFFTGLFAAVWLTVLLTLPAEAKMRIQEVTSPGGIKAWLVESRQVPLIAMRFGFVGGAVYDPDGKEGLSNFIAGMLDEGAGDMKSVAFQERAEELAVRMSFNAGRDMFIGSFQTLAENKDEAAKLLRLALTKPRFDADAVDRIKKQIITGLKFEQNDPRQVASKEWFRIAFDGHPYSRPVKGTIDTVGAISGEDLRDYAKRVFVRDNLTVAVVGDIDAKTLGPMLDKIFGDLPKSSDLKPIAEAKPPAGPQRKVIEMNVPQSVAVFGHSGLKRKDKDFIASYVLNYILGGGGFNSRLTEEVREKRGLAYSVYSYLSPYRRAAIYMGNVATENKSMVRSLEVIETELRRMAEKGPTAEELKNAKQYLTGSYPLRFDTSSKIASQLLWIQIEDLGLDYIDTRNSKIEAITLDDVRRVAKRLLNADGLIVTIVGKPEGVEKKS
ncbi:MAG: insulinase family protein [Hyphomicrobiaceae bacterium]|nr:insulinase family protein [Hyphomicrobiaceae bacterium]